MATYLVFGRRAYPDPLEERGALDAEDAESARVRALERFPGPWVELVLVPTEDAYWVLGPVGTLRAEGAGVAGRVD